jgi:hypothetical protein
VVIKRTRETRTCGGQYLKDPEEDPGLSDLCMSAKNISDQKAFIKTFLAIRISMEVFK